MSTIVGCYRYSFTTGQSCNDLHIHYTDMMLTILSEGVTDRCLYFILFLLFDHHCYLACVPIKEKLCDTTAVLFDVERYFLTTFVCTTHPNHTPTRSRRRCDAQIFKQNFKESCITSQSHGVVFITLLTTFDLKCLFLK